MEESRFPYPGIMVSLPQDYSEGRFRSHRGGIFVALGIPNLAALGSVSTISASESGI